MANHRQIQQLLSNLYKARDAVGGVDCEGAPDNFFPEDYLDPLTRRLATDAAKTICKECPVIAECANYALTAREPFGIWGGLTSEDRRQLYPLQD